MLTELLKNEKVRWENEIEEIKEAKQLL